MAFFFILCHYLLVINIAYTDCRWTVADATKGHVTLDLSCIKEKYHHIHIKGNAADSQHDYYWSMCSNGESCTDQQAMVRQTVNGKASDCHILARYENSIAPAYLNSGGPHGDTWIFQYANGQNDCGHPARTWAPTFRCEPDVEWQLGHVQEELNSCYYQITILTKYACSDEVVHCTPSNESNSVNGWLFLFGLLALLFLYFLSGYLIMGLCVNKEGGITDFRNNIPQKAFWMNFPSFLLAGCIFSKDFLCGLCKADKVRDTGDKEESFID